MNENIVFLIDILETIKNFIKNPESDIFRSHFDSKEDLIYDLDSHMRKLTEEDFSSIEDLIILFAPTSDLQEISLDNGWGDQYLTLSKKFDKAIEEIIRDFKIDLFSDTE